MQFEGLDDAAHPRHEDLVVTFLNGRVTVCAPEDVGELLVIELVNLVVEFDGPDQGAPVVFGLLDYYDNNLFRWASDDSSNARLRFIFVNVQVERYKLLSECSLIIIVGLDRQLPCRVNVPQE